LRHSSWMHDGVLDTLGDDEHFLSFFNPFLLCVISDGEKGVFAFLQLFDSVNDYPLFSYVDILMQALISNPTLFSSLINTT
jgi:hypothetical protein